MIRKLDMTASWKKIGNIVFFANKILLSISWLDYNWAQLTGVTQLLFLGLDMDQIKFDEYFWPTFKPGTEQSFHPAKSLICPISNHSIGFFFQQKSMGIVRHHDSLHANWWYYMLKIHSIFSGHCYFNYTRI